MDLAAVVAFIDGHAVKLGAAPDHGPNDFLVAGRHVVSMAVDVLGAVSAEDLGDGLHVTAPSSGH
jgi:hypothetical protein